MSLLLTAKDLPFLSSQDIIDFFAALKQERRQEIIADLPIIIADTKKDVREDLPEIEQSLQRLSIILMCAQSAEEEFIGLNSVGN